MVFCAFFLPGGLAPPRPSPRWCFLLLSGRPGILPAMSGAHLDSEAHFEARVNQLGLQPQLEKLKKLGFRTFGRFAHSSTFVPGVSDGAILEKDLIVKVLGTRDHPEACQLQRLFYEAYTLISVDLRRQVDRTDEDLPRRLPVAERESRRRELSSKLAGMTLEGELDPSNRLQDIANDMYEENLLRYISWEDCTKRDLEVEGIKKDKSWREMPDGTLKAFRSDVSDPKVHIVSDLLLKNCLQRRGMVLDMADLMDYSVHELLVNLLISEYQREPMRGFGKITWDQLRNADKECFRILAAECRDGIRRDVNNRRPLDRQMLGVLKNPNFRFLLVGLPGASSSKRGRSASPPRGGGSASSQASNKQAARIKQLEAENRNLKTKKTDTFTKKKKEKDGKGKGKERHTPLPKGLAGKSAKSPSGEPLCFDYNLGGCTHAEPGQRCRKGYHLCAEPGCGKPHALGACPNRKD